MYKNSIVTTHWTRVVHEKSLLKLSELYLSHYKPVYYVVQTFLHCHNVCFSHKPTIAKFNKSASNKP